MNDQRLIVSLRHQGFTFRKISAALNIPYWKVRDLYRRGAWPTDVAAEDRRKREASHHA